MNVEKRQAPSQRVRIPQKPICVEVEPQLAEVGAYVYVHISDGSGTRARVRRPRLQTHILHNASRPLALREGDGVVRADNAQPTATAPPQMWPLRVARSGGCARADPSDSHPRDANTARSGSAVPGI
jgi:hypothetical protein